MANKQDMAALGALFESSNWGSITTVAQIINVWADMTFPDRVPEASLHKLVMEEVPELLIARKKKGDVGTEWADTMILLLDLAVIWNISPADAIRRKMKINANRSWVKDEATGFYNHIGESHDEAHGISKVAASVRHEAVDNSESVPGTDCSGTPIQGMGPCNVFIRSARGWHTTQLVRAGSDWVLGTCTRCGRDLDGRLALANQVINRRHLAGDTEETEGTGVG